MIFNRSEDWMPKPRVPAIWILVGISFVVLFLCSSLDHAVFRSGAWDLAIFDQAVYLISQGLTPLSSFLGFHILADHAAIILYPISLLYRIYPDVHWLLMVQALALALAAYPVFRLALLAGLSQFQGITVSVIYLLYPVVFNLNLFDFHAEVIAIPAIFWMVLAARTKQIGRFCIALAIALSCKEVLSLTVATMGLWMIVCEKKKGYGILALATGIAWFIIATQFIIPSIEPELALVSRHLFRYDGLGSSFSEVFLTMLTKPQLILGRVFSINTFRYLALLSFPVAYILFAKSSKSFLQLIPGIPALVMNILASDGGQRTLENQYALPIIPFLLLVVISCFQSESTFLNLSTKKGCGIAMGWSVLVFLFLSPALNFFVPSYYNNADNFTATREAISRIQGPTSVLTTSEISPHLSQRVNIQFANNVKIMNVEPIQGIDSFDYVLLNTRYPGWSSSTEFSTGLVDQLRKNDQFQLEYQQDDVSLFVKKIGG